MHLEARTIRI